MTLIRALTPSALVFTIVVSATAASLPQAPAAKIPYRLVDEVVFYATVPDNSQYDAEVRRELQQFRQRVRSYRPRPRPARLSGEMRMVYAARESYEGKLVASGGAGTERLAQQYVDELKPCYEWEGFHDCPEREALFAERYLAKNPKSPFRDFLPLLIAHRLFCTAEGYEREEQPQGAVRARQASQAPLAIALKSPSLLIRTAAQELRARGRCHSA